ncbi:MAG: hypothetical protein SW833_28385 [Cyanobacteriota bacterium]|nr:hypothetical protein [Cyanobacteriota bacterium]
MPTVSLLALAFGSVPRPTALAATVMSTLLLPLTVGSGFCLSSPGNDSTTWETAKPGIANAYVQSRMEQQSPEQEPITVGNEKLVLTNTSSVNTNRAVSGLQNLDPDTRKAVEEFLK